MQVKRSTVGLSARKTVFQKSLGNDLSPFLILLGRGFAKIRLAHVCQNLLNKDAYLLTKQPYGRRKRFCSRLLSLFRPQQMIKQHHYAKSSRIIIDKVFTKVPAKSSKLQSLGKRAFCTCCGTIVLELSANIRSQRSLATFKKKLKTFLASILRVFNF